MNPTTLSQLLELNRQFYQTFAIPFSATRMRLQPGVLHVLEGISPEADLHAVGWGNGELEFYKNENVDIADVPGEPGNKALRIIARQESGPGIVDQFGRSAMAAAKVICNDCHTVKADYPGAVEHEGVYILASPSSAMCTLIPFGSIKR